MISVKQNWSTRRVKFVADLNMGQSPPSEIVNKFDEKGGFPFLQGNAEFGDEFPSPLHACSDPAKVAKKGDLLISVRAPVGALNIADQDYGIGRGLCAIHWTNLQSRFGWWAMHHQRSQLDLNATGSTYDSVSAEDVSNTKLIYPGYDLQNQIANYLDRETTRIDTLITEKERMLTLLQEKRTALISQAVTCGLDPDVPLKLSGHFGYGDEPSKRDYGHAKKSNKTTLIPQYDTGDRRLRFLFDTVSGATPSSSVEKYWNGDIYWITPEDLGRLAGSELADTRRKISIEGYRNSGVELAPADSLIISKRAPIGQVAIVRVDSTCNQGCFLLTKKSILDERFYYYTLIHLRPFLEILGRGSTFTELSSDDLRSIRLPFPDLNTQKDIADHIDRETTRIDMLSKEILNSIELLKERRSALITTAVTGQINSEDMIT